VFAASHVPPPRVNELHLRTVLEQLPVALMRVDATGMLLAVNDAGLALLGADSLDLVLGTSLLAYLPDEDARGGCAAFLNDAAHGLRGSRELRMRSEAAGGRLVEAQAIPYPGASDQTTSVIVTFRDVSRTHALTHSLIEASERHAQLEEAQAAERERWIADRTAIDNLLGRGDDLERERDEARATLVDWQARNADLERTLEAERAERAELARAIEDQRVASEGHLAEVASDLQRRMAEQAAQHAASMTALESDFAAASDEVRQLQTSLAEAQSAAREADLALAEARSAATEARSALAASEAAFSQQREQSEADIAAARDDARRARDAWSDLDSARREAERRRQLVEGAVARFAAEIGLLPSEPGTPETGAVDSADSEAQSAW
jgi:hypothetical protein